MDTIVIQKRLTVKEWVVFSNQKLEYSTNLNLRHMDA